MPLDHSRYVLHTTNAARRGTAFHLQARVGELLDLAAELSVEARRSCPHTKQALLDLATDAVCSAEDTLR